MKMLIIYTHLGQVKGALSWACQIQEGEKEKKVLKIDLFF